MLEILLLVAKCLAVGIVWAALLVSAMFQSWHIVKYVIFLLPVAAFTYLFPILLPGLFSDREPIIAATLIALIALILSLILSFLAFRGGSGGRVKTIAFSAAVAGFTYLIYRFVVSVYVLPLIIF